VEYVEDVCSVKTLFASFSVFILALIGLESAVHAEFEKANSYWYIQSAGQSCPYATHSWQRGRNHPLYSQRAANSLRYAAKL